MCFFLEELKDRTRIYHHTFFERKLIRRDILQIDHKCNEKEFIRKGDNIDTLNIPKQIIIFK